MVDSTFDLGTQKVEWDEEGRALLAAFLHDVVNTPLKIKILQMFLLDPYLCLTSASLARRLHSSTHEVQKSARELYASNTFLYCQSFAYSDLCCLSFDRLSPMMQRNLCLLRFALRNKPEAVWTTASHDGSDSYSTT